MFSKFKVETPPNAYQYQLPIVEVYEAEIRKLRCENEFLKVQVVQLNEALAQLRLQQAEKTPFRSTEKEFFQLTKSARNTHKKNARLKRWYYVQFKDSRSLSQLRYVHFRLTLYFIQLSERFTFSHYSNVLSQFNNSKDNSDFAKKHTF